MEYRQLTETYKYDVIAEAMYARELEHFHYNFDRVNFEALLKTTPKGEYRDNIQARLEQTLIEMERVEQIYAALEAQVDDQQALETAITLRQNKNRGEK